MGRVSVVGSAAVLTRVTHPRDATAGLNRIEVESVQYGTCEMLMEKGVAVPVRDGSVLYANVFRPEDDGRHPVVACADIYGNDSVNMEVVRALGIAARGMYETSVFTPWESPDPGFWVPNGYVLVKAGLRGTAGAAGRIDPLSRTEAEDFFDIIEWAGTQPWSNGSVGTNGVSYLAMTQWRVAPLHPPHLKAMIPWEGASDLYRDWCFHGGIPDTGFVRHWLGVQQGRWPDSELEDIGAAQAEHPLLDDYWEGRTAALEDITVPLYVGGGWATQGLHTRGSIEGFQRSASRHKWLEVHGRKEWETYYGRESLERQRRFFDCFLKGEGNDWLDTAPVRIEVRERFYDGVTRLASAWPPPEAEAVSLYLDAEQRSLDETPPAREHVLRQSADAALRFDIRFDADTELTGPARLRLWIAAPEADDADIFVGIEKLDRRGRPVPFPDLNHVERGRVAYGWLRASHRELDDARSTPLRPWRAHRRRLALTPGEAVPLDVELLPSSTLFRAGETLRLVVGGSELPFTGPSGLRYAHANTVNRGDLAIHTGGRYDSRLVLPLIRRS